MNAGTLSETKRMLLERYLREDARAGAARVCEFTPGVRNEHAPLSLSQEQLLLREERNQGGPALYNECIKLKMEGPLDVLTLERSLSEIIQRHEIWRTSYELKDGQLVQVVHPGPETITLPVVDLQGLAPSRADAEMDRLASEMVQRPFDLKRGPLLRAKLFRISDEMHVLFFCAHLSIVDGVSVYQVFPSELAALYRAFSLGRPNPLPPLPAQFADHARRQRQWLHGEETARQVAYWKKQLAGPIPVLQWPADRPALEKPTYRGVIRSFPLPSDLVDAVEVLSRQDGVSLFMGLLAGFVSLLHLYTRQEDIIVGTPSPAGRKRSEAQKLLGYFLNPVALRFDLTGNPTFHAVLRQAQRLTLEALSNDDVPLEVLARELQADVDPGRHPFFNVAISLQPQMPELDLKWTVTSMDIGSGGAPWELYVAFIRRPQETWARVQYNPDVFDSATIRRMMADYQTLLRAVTDNSLVRIAQIDFSLRRQQRLVVNK
jgi:surfactin family lipopeptide synthetase A